MTNSRKASFYVGEGGVCRHFQGRGRGIPRLYEEIWDFRFAQLRFRMLPGLGLGEWDCVAAAFGGTASSGSK